MRDADVVRDEVEHVKRLVDGRTPEQHDDELHDLLVAVYPTKDAQDQ